MSQRVLSDLLGWSRQAWDQFERRNSDITTARKDTVKRLEEGFGRLIGHKVKFYKPTVEGGQFSFHPPDLSLVDVTKFHSFKTIREALGNITQVELAEILDISDAVIYGAETNKTKPNEETLWKVEDLIKEKFSKEVHVTNSSLKTGEFKVELENQVKSVNYVLYDGFVYFIQDFEGADVKIGYTTDLQKRLATFSTSTPANIRVIATLKGDKSLEQKIHQKFSHLRVRKDREYFRPDSDLFSWLSRELKKDLI